MFIKYNYEKEGKFEDALKEYNKVIKLDPQNIEAQYGVIYTNVQLGNESDVLILLEQYDLEELTTGEILFLMGYFEDALKIYDKLFEKEKTDEFWIKRQLISEKLYENNNLSEKINLKLIQAQNYENEKQYEEALSIYEDILNHDKFSHNALYGALKSSIHLDKKSKIRELLKTIEILPENIKQNLTNSYIITMQKIAIDYQKSEKNGAAISAYRDLLLIDEYNKEALKEYGKLLEKMEMYEEAIRTYEKLSMLESENFAYNEKIKNLKMIQDKK